MPLWRHAVDDLIHDGLDARPHVLDPPRGKGLHHQPAQTGVIGWILLQHPVAHALIDRLLEDGLTVPPGHAADEVFAKPLVAQDRAHVLMAARYQEAERRAVHWIALTQAMIMWVGVADELRRQRVEAGVDLLGG